MPETGAVPPTNLVTLTSVDSSRAPWEMLHIAQTGADIPHKPLFHDDETGTTVLLIRYAAGFTNTWHTHPCAHGMLVLDGVLKRGCKHNGVTPIKETDTYD